MDKSFIGKYFISNNIYQEIRPFVIVGFDFLNKKYLAIPICSINLNYMNSKTFSYYKGETLTSIEEILKICENQAAPYKVASDIYRKYAIRFKDNSEKITAYERVWRRISETQNYINTVEIYAKNQKEKAFWQDRKREAEKGLKRALKFLHHILDDEDCKKMDKWLEENKYKDVSKAVEYYQKIMANLENIKKDSISIQKRLTEEQEKRNL